MFQRGIGAGLLAAGVRAVHWSFRDESSEYSVVREESENQKRMKNKICRLTSKRKRDFPRKISYRICFCLHLFILFYKIFLVLLVLLVDVSPIRLCPC